MKHSTVLLISLGWPLLSLAGCRHEDDFNPPTPPDMSALLSAYEQPTGALTAGSAVQLAQGLVSKAKDLRAAAVLVGSLSNALASLDTAKDKEASGLTAEDESPVSEAGGDGRATVSQALSGSIDLWMRASWICTGWDGADAPVDDKWGRIVLNAIGSAKALGDVFWGRFDDCQLLQTDGLQQKIDGTVDVRVPTTGADTTDLLVRFAGTWLGADGKLADLDVDFRLFEGTLSTLQDTEKGSFVVEMPFAQLESLLQGGGLAVRDAGGAWSCTFGTNLEGGACQRGDDSVSW